MTESLDLDAIKGAYLNFDPEWPPVARLICAVRERDTEIARLRAVPLEERIARALQQYGDERAREAADQANRVYELHNRLVGHVEMDSESRAEWVMKQSLDGLHIGENNRESIKDYLAGHFQQAMVDAAAAAREAAIEECAQVTAGPWPATRLYQDDTRFLQTKAVAAIRTLAANPGSET